MRQLGIRAGDVDAGRVTCLVFLLVSEPAEDTVDIRTACREAKWITNSPLARIFGVMLLWLYRDASGARFLTRVITLVEA